MTSLTCWRRPLRLVLLLLAFVVALFAQRDEENFRRLREEMVQKQLAGRRWGAEALHDRVVLEAFRQAPRHRFVPDALVPHAYEDRPLPIGYGQTISQPSGWSSSSIFMRAIAAAD